MNIQSRFSLGAIGHVAYDHDAETWTVNGKNEGRMAPALAWVFLECVRRAGITVTVESAAPTADMVHA